MEEEMSTQDEINRLDLAYQKLTGRKFKASGIITGREQIWHAFIHVGFTIKDLEDVILWIKRGILSGIRHEAAINFRRLVGDLGVFEDELQTCRAELRNAKPHVTPKEQVVQQFRPTVVSAPAKSDAKHVGELIAELKRAAGMEV
jgi:hypothetical protein